MKWLLASGLAWLEHNREHVNHNNVFPVPDGDTGTNMQLTMQRAYQAIEHVDETHAGAIASQFAKGALLGARGNSGVILSQLIRGFADEIVNHGTIDAPAFARAVERGVDMAYKAVIEPVEGTILTVANRASRALNAYVAQGSDLCEALDTLIGEARAALDDTPDMLSVLRQAGVVDSGGLGLVYILEGMSRSVNGLPVVVHETNGASANTWASDLDPDDVDGYGYDVQFLMYGAGMDVDKVRTDLDAMGWSTLVVGDESLIKVHIHVHDPGQPLSYGVAHSNSIADVVVENMQRQYESYVENNHRETVKVQVVEGTAVVAVASGDGMVDAFYEAGAAYVIPGGQTMNPSTDDFLEAIEALDNDHIILLPNNKNVLLAASQASEAATGAQVSVVPTTTVPQGLTAMLAYLDVKDESEPDAISEAMDEARHDVLTGEITVATRDAHLNGLAVSEGQYIGLLDGALVVGEDDLQSAVLALMARADAANFELVTLYYGADVSEAQAEAMRQALSATYPGQRFQVLAGGQPLYPYLISLE